MEYCHINTYRLMKLIDKNNFVTALRKAGKKINYFHCRIIKPSANGNADSKKIDSFANHPQLWVQYLFDFESNKLLIFI